MRDHDDPAKAAYRRRKRERASERGHTRPASREPSSNGSEDRAAGKGRKHERTETAPSTDSISCVAASNLKTRKVSWLWPGRIAFGEVTLPEGDKGVGKSSIAASLAAVVTAGEKLPGRRAKGKESVLWLPGEEDPESTIIPRLVAAKADLGRVHFVGHGGEDGVALSLVLPDQAPALERLIVERDAKLVIIDPLPFFVSQALDLSRYQDMREVMGALVKVARKTGCAILTLRNLTKVRGGPAIHQGIGSVAIAGVARTVLRASRRPDRPGQYVLSVVACNIAKPAPSLGYELADAGEVGAVRWGEELAVTAEELASEQGDAGERDAMADARRLLREALREGPRKATELLSEAVKAGIGERTLRRAKAALGVGSRRVGSLTEAYYEWLPPEAGWPTDMP